MEMHDYLKTLSPAEINRRYTGGDFTLWRDDFARWLSERFASYGLGEYTPPLPPSRVTHEAEWHGTKRTDVLFDTEYGTEVTATVLESKIGGKDGAAVVCLHGSTPRGRLPVIGDRSESPAEIGRYNYDYGLRLAQAGYTTISLDLAGITSDADALNLLLFGRDMLAMHVSGVRTAITLISGWSGVDSRRVGICGFELGAGVATFAAALDDRIKAVVASHPASSYLDGAPGSQVIPGLLPDADMPDVLGSIAPRPLWVDWEGTGRSYDSQRQVELCYSAVGATDHLHASSSAQHEFDFDGALGWFDDSL